MNTLEKQALQHAHTHNHITTQDALLPVLQRLQGQGYLMYRTFNYDAPKTFHIFDITPAGRKAYNEMESRR
jgi:hypothetical protein